MKYCKRGHSYFNNRTKFGSCRICLNNQHRTWQKANLDKVRQIDRAKHYKRQYGITINEYDSLFKKQNGLCAICHLPPTKKRLQIDHSHTTKNIRGLLCFNCNIGLGYFKDSDNILLSAWSYLRENV